MMAQQQPPQAAPSILADNYLHQDTSHDNARFLQLLLRLLQHLLLLVLQATLKVPQMRPLLVQCR
jgi:hypothetical protein